MVFDAAEVARSIELYNLGAELLQRRAEGDIKLVTVREPFLRERAAVDKVVVAFGSYDPLTKAHESLFLKGLEAVHEEGSLDEIIIVTSTQHWNKSVDLQKNSTIYDRVHAQEGFASCIGGVSLALFNDPFFINLAPAVAAMYEHAEINFVVGVDVMEKVLDPQGYIKHGSDPDTIIPELMKYHWLVAERRMPGEEVQDAHSSPIIAPYAKRLPDHIIPFDLQGDYEGLAIPIQDVSSSLVRKRRNDGEQVEGLEAVGISDFVDKRGIYIQDSNLYAASACARQRFADEHPGEAIANYIGELIEHMNALEHDPQLRVSEIARYGGRS